MSNFERIESLREIIASIEAIKHRFGVDEVVTVNPGGDALKVANDKLERHRATWQEILSADVERARRAGATLSTAARLIHAIAPRVFAEEAADGCVRLVSRAVDPGALLLFEAEIWAAIEAATAALPPGNKSTTPAREKVDWEGKALLLLKDHPAWSDSKIAAECGVHRSTISKSDLFQNAAACLRGTAPTSRDRRRGRRGASTPRAKNGED